MLTLFETNLSRLSMWVTKMFKIRKSCKIFLRIRIWKSIPIILIVSRNTVKRKGRFTLALFKTNQSRRSIVIIWVTKMFEIIKSCVIFIWIRIWEPIFNYLVLFKKYCEKKGKIHIGIYSWKNEKIWNRKKLYSFDMNLNMKTDFNFLLLSTNIMTNRGRFTSIFIKLICFLK